MPFMIYAKTGGPEGKIAKRFGPFRTEKQALELAQLVADEHRSKTVTVEHVMDLKRVRANPKKKGSDAGCRDGGGNFIPIPRCTGRAGPPTPPPKRIKHRGTTYRLVKAYSRKSDATRAVKRARKQEGIASAVVRKNGGWTDKYAVYARGPVKKKTTRKRKTTRRRKNPIYATETPTGAKTTGWITREGKLGGSGYTDKPATTRHRLLARSVSVYGYASTLGSLQALLRGRMAASKKQKIQADKNWLMKRYGGRG